MQGICQAFEPERIQISLVIFNAPGGYWNPKGYRFFLPRKSCAVSHSEETLSERGTANARGRQGTIGDLSALIDFKIDEYFWLTIKVHCVLLKALFYLVSAFSKRCP